MVAMPPIMMASSSDCVILATYGLTISGASVWPMKTFAAAERLSAPLTPFLPISKTIHLANTQTTDCKIRR